VFTLLAWLIKSAGNGEVLPPAGKRGAAAALQRLEEQEERAHSSLAKILQFAEPQRYKSTFAFFRKHNLDVKSFDYEEAHREGAEI
jgi:hypothetical protein